MTVEIESTADFIVVGGGAAGCVVASRLSETSSNKVILLEAGGHSKSLMIRMPGGYFRVMGTKRTYQHHTVAQKLASNRELSIYQARTIGGGTSINAMLYVRGDQQDYNGWAASGCDGWDFNSVLPYFKKAEANLVYSGKLHGTDGPLVVSTAQYRHPLTDAFLRAADEFAEKNQLPGYNHDFNGNSQLGHGLFQTMTFNAERGSAAVRYLQPALKRSNLELRLNSSVKRIVFEGRRAVGVVIDHGGRDVLLKARREIIICAGALISPKILLNSGIGPGDHLRDIGIDVVNDLPGVGANYQDHYVVPVDGELKQPISLVGEDRGLKAIRHGLQWLLSRSGLLSSNLCEAGAFYDVDGDDRAEVQLHVIAASTARWGAPEMAELHGISIAPCCLTSHSRGVIRLRSKDPNEPPVLDPKILSHPTDLANHVAGVKIARAILKSPSVAALLKQELFPGHGVGSDETSTIQYIRDTVKTAFHPAGTCKMGRDPEAVVGVDLKVHGVEGLRVADASVMPTLVRGNTTAPTVMIGERAAAFVLA